ncbi:MAG: hexokinase [Negativicutes bacterium]|nr:hexokinase [Negativicutes bacterium]
MGNSARLQQLKVVFSLAPAQLQQIADRFQADMSAGLAGEPSSLKMLPSYLAKPTGNEQGHFLALDFGGTNVRVQLIDLSGDGQWVVRRKIAAPLADPAGLYDYTTAATVASGLFDFLAGQIAAVVDDHGDYRLGHTFSFPCRQHGLNQAVLLHWTKEIKTTGVEGQEINALLAAALLRRGLSRVKPCAILNDTVGTLLTAAYGDLSADIGSICGTGHNTCYFEPTLKIVINMESGNFAALPVTKYDQQLDADSEKPGTQQLEKMVAGRYLGELVRLIAVDYLPLTLPPGSVSAEDLAAIIGDIPVKGPLARLTAAESEMLQEIAGLVTARSARLVAATFLGVLSRIDPVLESPHTIAVDGSLYEKMPGYAGMLAAALVEVLGDKAAKVTIKLSKDGSGIGAAIAAAVAGPTAG